MSELVRKPCPQCGKSLVVIVDPSGKGRERCKDCEPIEAIDPLKSPQAVAWTESSECGHRLTKPRWHGYTGPRPRTVAQISLFLRFLGFWLTRPSLPRSCT